MQEIRCGGSGLVDCSGSELPIPRNRMFMS